MNPLDTFALLAAVGWECAGAVTVMPSGVTLPRPDYRPLSRDEVGERLDALPGHPFDTPDELRVSLGGHQDKLILARLDGAWNLSIGGAPTTHLLKPEPVRWPGLAVAEAWSLRLAAVVTPAATAAVAAGLGARPVLVVERYDRVVSASGIGRIHQEDGCQMLGLLPSRKYAEPRGRVDDPSYGRIADLLRTHAADVAAELLVLLRQMVLAVALMNTDGHAKNLSVLHDEHGFARMAPVYDIVPTTAFLTAQRHIRDERQPRVPDRSGDPRWSGRGGRELGRSTSGCDRGGRIRAAGPRCGDRRGGCVVSRPGCEDAVAGHRPTVPARAVRLMLCHQQRDQGPQVRQLPPGAWADPHCGA